MINSQDIWNRLDQIRTSKPLILSITNIVVTNITANMLLALGA
ncbi:MAG: hydroxyethylthiazole kinase, partial [Desulfonatronovibrio sp.]